MSNGGYLGESSTKAEIERRFLNAKHVMDAFMEAYYGITFAEMVRLMGQKDDGEGKHKQ